MKSLRREMLAPYLNSFGVVCSEHLSMQLVYLVKKNLSFQNISKLEQTGREHLSPYCRKPFRGSLCDRCIRNRQEAPCICQSSCMDLACIYFELKRYATTRH